ncbi:tetratricopeptide repeat protein [Oceanospirillaceae bacterium ASx5O]|nr:tetratricopeptide repeat protein [Oceanospirillaceae bacterium ASx5O]
MKYWISLSLLALLSGCSLFGGNNTIGSLKSSQPEQSDLDFANLDHQQVRQEYQELLDLVDDQFLKEQIERRIAGVSMAGGDQQQGSQARPQRGYYREAINSYIDILEKYPNSPDNAEVLYQLSKAYEMEGEINNTEAMLKRLITLHPDYSGVAEAHFRLGDIRFSHQDYRQAEVHYRASTRTESPQLSLNAHYMLGWALYKRGLFDDALESFALVLNRIMDSDGSATDQQGKPMLPDTLHSISLALVNIGGADKIDDVRGLRNKDWIWQVYENLGAYYLEKNRYADSAATYRHFVRRFPLDRRAPDMQNRLIAAYTKGAFARDVLLAKQDYVHAYGIGSAYWQQADAPQQQTLRASLQPYLRELAAHYHAQAQQQTKLGSDQRDRDLQKKARQSYQDATGYYALYLSSFPDSSDRAQQRFLKAEAHFEAGQFSAAAADYEQVSYQYQDTKFNNRAGYAAIIAWQQRVTELEKKPAEKSAAQEQAVASMLRFAAAYDSDERSPAVLTNAASYLFSLNRYQQAIDIADELLQSKQKLDKKLQQTAYGIMAHSYFQLQNYAAAETHYDRQRQLTPAGPEYTDISNRMAIAVFKKAEGLIAAGQKPAAATELLRIKQIAPGSSIRVAAQYDAAVLLLGNQQWQPAISELEELRRHYPQHELAAEFPRKLAFGYEQAGRLKDAAALYLYLYRNDQDETVKRDALFATAGLHEKTGRAAEALEFYKTWARNYEQPFDNRMEARYRIAVIYDQQQDMARKLFWLRRIIEGDAGAGQQRSDRSQWLAAWAANEYGDYFAKEFSSRRLASNLERNLPWKQQMLQDAVSRYQQAADYGLLEFTTRSSFRIASLYQQFAAELRGLPVPAGLSEQDAATFRSIIADQATPMQELAVAVYSSNIEQAWQGHYNEWISNSYQQLAQLQPARFNKHEQQKRYGDEIR